MQALNAPKTCLLPLAFVCAISAGVSNRAIAQVTDNFLAKSRAVTVSSYPPDGVVLGQGWDNFLERKAGGACVTGSILALPGQEISYKLDKIEDIEQIFNSLEMSASAKFKAFGTSAEVSSSFSKSLRVDNRALNMMALIKVDRGGAYLAPHFKVAPQSGNVGTPDLKAVADSAAESSAEQLSKVSANQYSAGMEWSGRATQSGGGLRLTPEAIDALKQDLGDLENPNRDARPLRFRRLCGDHFVAAIKMGGEMLGVINIVENSRERKEALSISLKVKGLSAEGGASINTSLSELQKTNGLKFDSYQRGGNPSLLVTTLDEFVSKIRTFASIEGFIPHPYTIHTLPYSAVENWPDIPDPSRETEYLNQLANLHARFSQLKRSYDEVIVNILSPAVTIATQENGAVVVNPVPRTFQIGIFGNADTVHKASENTHNLLKVYADHLESCFFASDCNIEEELALQSSTIAVTATQLPLNLPANPTKMTIHGLSQILADQPAGSQKQMESISKIALDECGALASTIPGSQQSLNVLKSDVAGRLTSMALSFGAETAFAALKQGPEFYAPLVHKGSVVYCRVDTPAAVEENIQKVKRRLNPYALYYQLVAQMPAVVGEIPFDTIIDTTQQARKHPDGTIKDAGNNIVSPDSPTAKEILDNGNDALRWWLVTERLLPIARSFCDQNYKHPMCFSMAELRDIVESVELNPTFDLYANRLDVPAKPVVKPQKPREKRASPRWDGPCPHNPTICI